MSFFVTRLMLLPTGCFAADIMDRMLVEILGVRSVDFSISFRPLKDCGERYTCI